MSKEGLEARIDGMEKALDEVEACIESGDSLEEAKIRIKTHIDYFEVVHRTRYVNLYDKDETEMSDSRRRETAREALEIGMDDPYWLYNLKGEIKEIDILKMSRDLQDDSDLLEIAFERIKKGEWLPSEAALYIAENANFGDYGTAEKFYSNLPIQPKGDEEDDN